MVEERRKGERVRGVFPIGVRVGSRKLLPGCTLDASRKGVLLLCTESVPVGTEIHVTNLTTDDWYTCRVVRKAGKDESGRHAFGVEILEEGVEDDETPVPKKGRRAPRG